MASKKDLSTTTSVEPVKRRDLLKTAWAVLGGLAAIELGGISLAYMQPRLAEGEFGGLISAGNVDDFPPGSVTHIPSARCYLSRLPDGGFLAIYQRCTHLGCSVPWDQAAQQFVCPCHSSSFDTQGDVLNAPAPRPLDIFPIVIEEGVVKIDTGSPVARQAIDPGQVVYS